MFDTDFWSLLFFGVFILIFLFFLGCELFDEFERQFKNINCDDF